MVKNLPVTDKKLEQNWQELFCHEDRLVYENQTEMHGIFGMSEGSSCIIIILLNNGVIGR